MGNLSRGNSCFDAGVVAVCRLGQSVPGRRRRLASVHKPPTSLKWPRPEANMSQFIQEPQRELPHTRKAVIIPERGLGKAPARPEAKMSQFLHDTCKELPSNGVLRATVSGRICLPRPERRRHWTKLGRNLAEPGPNLADSWAKCPSAPYLQPQDFAGLGAIWPKLAKLGRTQPLNL